MAELKVVELDAAPFRDVPRMLRKLADDIEAGTYGDVGPVAVALRTEGLEVFGFGTDSTVEMTAVMFHAAAIKLAKGLL